MHSQPPVHSNRKVNSKVKVMFQIDTNTIVMQLQAGIVS